MMFLYQNEEVAESPIVESPAAGLTAGDPAAAPADPSADWGLNWFESIVLFFRSLYDSVLVWLRWCMDVVSSWFFTLMSFCSDFCIWIVDSVVYFINLGWELCFGESGFVWLPFAFCFDFIDWAMSGTEWAFTDWNFGLIVGTFDFTEAMDLLDSVNCFFPVDEAIMYMGIFLCFFVVFIIVKYVLKLIPTIG